MTKREVSRRLVRAVCQLKERGKEAGRVDQARELSTEQALRILERQGWEEAAEASASRVNAIAREELGYRRTKRVTRFEAAYATQVYLLDFSRLKYFQVFDEDEEGNYLLKTTRRSMSYKEPQGRFRAWIALLVDDHSRLSLGHVFATTGEDPRLGLGFLTWAFTRERDDHLLRYAPEVLQTDAGAFDAEASRRALADCGIELEGGFSKHSQGKVERAFRSLWQRWELPLAVDKPEGWTITLPDLNALLHEHLIREGRQQHPRRRRYTREEAYATSLPGHARTLHGVDLTALAYHVETRTVTREGRVSIDNQSLLVPQETADGVWIDVGDKIRVMTSLDGGYKGRLSGKLHADAFDLAPAPADAPRGAYDTLTAPTMTEKIKGQIDLSRPAGQSLADAGLGPDDVYDALSNGALEMPDVYPRPQRLRPDAASPFTEPAAGDVRVEAEPDLLFGGEAKNYIGRRLRPLGEDYTTAESLFADLVEDGATRPEIEERLDLLREEKAAEKIAS